MNGHARTEASAYSFYLNLIVLDHVVPSRKQDEESSSSIKEEDTSLTDSLSSPPPISEEMENGSTDQEPPPAIVEQNDDEEISERELEAQEPEKNSLVPTMPWASPDKEKKKDLLKKSLHGLDEKFRNNMRGLSKRSSQVATKAGAYAARRTMVSRAMTALNKSLPEISAIYNTDLTIGKRFSQGKVSVLHVVLKPSAMSRYLTQVKGGEEGDDNDAAEKYSLAMSTLESLGATDTMKSLEREMLMQVRKGLMDKLSTLLLTTMKEKENGLELQCIALEEAEEARWLFTFMEFQAQMKS